MLNHDLSHHQDTDLDLIRTVTVLDLAKYPASPYTLHTTEEVPESLGDMFLGWLCAWNSQAVLPVRQWCFLKYF